MEAADYTELLRQAEEELGRTPGAYCSRKVAVRAMELLKEYGQKQYEEDVVGVVNQVKMREKDIADLNQTIKRQAEAIQRLEAEKTRRIAVASPTKESAEREFSRVQELVRRERDRYGMPQLNPLEQSLIEREREKRRRMEAERSRFRGDPRDGFLKHFLDSTGPGWQDLSK